MPPEVLKACYPNIVNRTRGSGGGSGGEAAIRLASPPGCLPASGGGADAEETAGAGSSGKPGPDSEWAVVYEGARYVSSCDVYAMCTVVWECFTRLAPYEGWSDGEGDVMGKMELIRMVAAGQTGPMREEVLPNPLYRAYNVHGRSACLEKGRPKKSRREEVSTDEVVWVHMCV